MLNLVDDNLGEMRLGRTQHDPQHIQNTFPEDDVLRREKSASRMLIFSQVSVPNNIRFFSYKELSRVQ